MPGLRPFMSDKTPGPRGKAIIGSCSPPTRLVSIPSTGKYKHYIFSFLIQIALAGFFYHDWDGFVFITTAEQFLEGLTPYEIALDAPLYTFSPGPPWMQAWYAYPPLPLLLFSGTYAPYFHLIGDNPILGRVFLKLGFILGNLLCAYLVYRLIAGISSEKKAARAEKIVLYNPFLIFIAAVWGMFDIWVANFLFLGILRLRQDRLKRAAICLGLSLLVKPIAVIFAPVLLAHVWNKTRSPAKTILLIAVAIATFVAVCLPFFIHCPQGFMDQVFGLHADRVPQGLSPLHLLYVGELIDSVGPFHIPSLPASTISAISVVSLAVTITLISAYHWMRKETEERGLIASFLLTMLCFTIFNRVVNPQYLVIPIVLALVCIYSYDSYSTFRLNDIRRYCKLLIIPALLYSLLVAGHFVRFIAPDVAMDLIGKTGAQLDLQLAFGFPMSPALYYAIICSVGPVLLITPAIVMAGIIVYRAFKEIVPSISKELAPHLTRSKLPNRRRATERCLTIVLACSLVVMPALAGAASYALASKKETPPTYATFNKEDKLVGILYYCGWDNSSHDPKEKYDDWPKAGLTPEEGYYESTYAYMEEDILQMKAADIDFAVLSFRHYYTERFNAFAQAAEEQQFPFVPMVELCDLEIYEQPSDWEHPGLTDKTRRELLERIDMVLADKDSPSYLRYEGKPVLFVHRDSYFPANEVPYDPAFWSELRSNVEDKHGEVFWITDLGQNDGEVIPNIIDSTFYLPPTIWLPTNNNEEAWETWEERMLSLSENNFEAFVATVMPYYNNSKISPAGQEISEYRHGQLTYDLFWESALTNQPDIVLIFSWNEYFESTCIEPTEEFGTEFLSRTQFWTSKFKEPYTTQSTKLFASQP